MKNQCCRRRRHIARTEETHTCAGSFRRYRWSSASDGRACRHRRRRRADAVGGAARLLESRRQDGLRRRDSHGRWQWIACSSSCGSICRRGSGCRASCAARGDAGSCARSCGTAIVRRCEASSSKGTASSRTRFGATFFGGTSLRLTCSATFSRASGWYACAGPPRSTPSSVLFLSLRAHAWADLLAAADDNLRRCRRARPGALASLSATLAFCSRSRGS